MPITQADLNALPTLPAHVAIIMDGNGRWAKSRGRARRVGHRIGGESARAIITASAATERIAQLTLYAFSTENWRRPKAEVEFLMRELARFLRNERKTVLANNIRFRALGRIEGLPKTVRRELAVTEETSASNTGMVLGVCLNYGSRQEIADAMAAAIRDAQAGRLDPERMDDETVRRYLYQSDIPDVDLLIRTAGEYRLSNFLLWQMPYAELYVTPTLFPEFRLEAYHTALSEFGLRRRTYGGLSES